MQLKYPELYGNYNESFTIRNTRESYLDSYLDTGVASKQLRMLHGRVGDSTIVVNSLSPQMSELVEDAKYNVNNDYRPPMMQCFALRQLSLDYRFVICANLSEAAVDSIC